MHPCRLLIAGFRSQLWCHSTVNFGGRSPIGFRSAICYTARMSLMNVNRSLSLLVFLMAPACGGSVDDGTSSAPPASTGDTSGNGSTSSGTGSFVSSQLADCTPGFPFAEASETKPCLYLANDQCYPSQGAACGCICPRDKASVVCVSGQDSWSSQTMFISCI